MPTRETNEVSPHVCTENEAQRNAVVAAYPRGNSFKKDIIGAFYHGMKHRPDSTFGTVNDDVLAYCDPNFKRADFCRIILQSPWGASPQSDNGKS